MIVLKDSMPAGSEVPSTPKSVTDDRQFLLVNGVLERRDGNFVFLKDHLFSSPSAAAGVVLGRSANGLVEWKDSAGHTLKKNNNE